MENPDTLAELHSKLASLATKWRFIEERYGTDPDANRPAIRPVDLQRRPASGDKAALDAYKAATIKARETILEFGELARAIVQFFGRDKFPAAIPDPPEFVFHPIKMQENAFGTKDPLEAGKLAIVWAAATRKEWSIGVRRGFRIVVERWAASMVHGYRAKDGSHGNWCVYQDVIPLALLAFEKLAAAHNAAADVPKETSPRDEGQIQNAGPFDLKGERFARLHRRFLDASPKFPYLRYIAATGHNNCPGWPNVPDSSGYDYLGLRHKDWLDVMNKPPGTLFAPIGGEQWLQIDGQLWQGAFYFDGPLANPTDADHESLQRQYAELRGAVDHFELLAHEAAGFLGNLPSVHRLVDFPREPKSWHRWLEAVCASAPVEPAGYHCFDVRRVPGNIFQASAILLERLQTATDNAAAELRPRAPLNVNECDLRPVLAAAEAFEAERRKADERSKFDDGGALHILGIARRHLAEALAVVSRPDGLTGDDATVGAIHTLLKMANDGRADSRVERIEAVIAVLRKATGHQQEPSALREGSALPAVDEAAATKATSARLSPGQQNIVDAIREAGRRLSQDQVLAALEAKHGAASIGTTKNYLAALVKFGVLTNRRDVHPPGYGLAEWG